jgi:diguanylate cyclase
MDEQAMRNVLALFESSEQMIGVFDETDTLRWANSAFRQALGLRPEEFPTWEGLIRMGRERQQGTRIVTDDFEAWLTSAKTRRGKLPFRMFEADCIDGRWLLMGETTVRSGWMLCLASDVTAHMADGRSLRSARDQALRAALTDELTQIANRRHLMQRLTMLTAPPGICFALVLLDIDHFKRVNDSYGHDVGDEVIRSLAYCLRRFTRRDDLAGRWGGEEFALLLPDITPQALHGLLERLFAEVRQARPSAAHAELSYTVSAGIVLAQPGHGVTELVKAADEALYAAKQGGRDRYLLAPPLPLD